MKLQLNEIKDALNKIVLVQCEMQEQLKTYDQSIKDLQDPIRRTSSTTFQREATITVNGKIYIFGGIGRKDSESFEIFNWSTRTWTLIENSLFFGRFCSYSFIYGKKIMICGGNYTERI